MNIRLFQHGDEDALWSMLEPTFRAGDTYAFPSDCSRESALNYWLNPTHTVYICELSALPVGTYLLRPNQSGGGAHVANCGFITAPASRGRGVASAMCRHSLEAARAGGFKAMQFNFVVSTNTGAVRLWENMGFAIFARLPGAFLHPAKGFVDALVMFREL